MYFFIFEINACWDNLLGLKLSFALLFQILKTTLLFGPCCYILVLK